MGHFYVIKINLAAFGLNFRAMELISGIVANMYNFYFFEKHLYVIDDEVDVGCVPVQQMAERPVLRCNRAVPDVRPSYKPSLPIH